MDNSYMKRRIRLQKNISYYRRLGIDVDWFKLPEMPKGKIGKRAEKALDKAIAQWEYYKGKPLTEKNRKLVGNISRAGEKNIQSQLENMGFIRQKQKYEKMLDAQQAPPTRSLPDLEGNAALEIYAVAADALDPSGSHKGKMTTKQKAFFNVVARKAQISTNKFDFDLGFWETDPETGEEKNEIYAQHLEMLGNFSEVKGDFEDWLWESDQYLNPDLSGLERVCDYMTKDATGMSYLQKQEWIQAKQSEYRQSKARD